MVVATFGRRLMRRACGSLLRGARRLPAHVPAVDLAAVVIAAKVEDSLAPQAPHLAKVVLVHRVRRGRGKNLLATADAGTLPRVYAADVRPVRDRERREGCPALSTFAGPKRARCTPGAGLDPLFGHDARVGGGLERRRAQPATATSRLLKQVGFRKPSTRNRVFALSGDGRGSVIASAALAA